MRNINTISSDPRQEFILPIDGGTTNAVLLIEFRPNQSSWFYSISYGDTFSAVNERLVASPNLLRPYKNLIPFGLLLTTNSGIDPLTIDAFSSGEAKLSILSATEVAQVDAEYYG